MVPASADGDTLATRHRQRCKVSTKSGQEIRTLIFLDLSDRALFAVESAFDLPRSLWMNKRAMSLMNDILSLNGMNS